MKNIILSLFFFFSFIQARGQYYQNALGLNGIALKTALHNIIKNHNVQSWPLWTFFQSTDNKGGNIVWDIYSDIPGSTPPYTYTFGVNECGSYNSEADCYNHEHLWPKSYFNDALPMNTDLHHLYPTDGYVNNKRGNLPFGETGNADWTSMNGSKYGNGNTYPGSNLKEFEPIDEYKGDIARVYFYMSTRYYLEDNGWQNWEMADGADLTPEAIQLLLTWHHNDTVSQKEIDRNNAVYGIQGNRNPFIDYPVFADCIWGTGDCTPLYIPESKKSPFKYFPNPVTDQITFEGENILDIRISDITGKIWASTKDKKISLTGYPSGLYFATIQNDHTMETFKIVIR